MHCHHQGEENREIGHVLRFSIGHSIFYGLDHLSKLAKFTISCRIGYIITKTIIWKLDYRKINTVFYCVFRTFRIFGVQE